MQATFWVALEVRDALVTGDLDRARDLARWLAAQDMQGTLPPRWKPWLEGMQKSAAEVAAAADLPTAALAVGELGMSCGSCHWNFGVRGPAAGDSEDQGFPPEGPEDMVTRMIRHQWATDELWLGLASPSETSWKTGTRVLLEMPFAPPEQDGRTITPELARGLEAIRDFGVEAEHVDTMADRARLYGKLLGSCAACHAPGAQAQ